jgi:energy-coupling factor transporter transmembrane protein EcfT
MTTPSPRAIRNSLLNLGRCWYNCLFHSENPTKKAFCFVALIVCLARLPALVSFLCLCTSAFFLCLEFLNSLCKLCFRFGLFLSFFCVICFNSFLRSRFSPFLMLTSTFTKRGLSKTKRGQWYGHRYLRILSFCFAKKQADKMTLNKYQKTEAV